MTPFCPQLGVVVMPLCLCLFCCLLFSPHVQCSADSVADDETLRVELGNENADERSWALRRVHKVQFGASHSFMGTHRAKAEDLASRREADFVRYLSFNDWEMEAEEAEVHFLHVPDQPNMRIEFGTDEYGAAYCDIGVFDVGKLMEEFNVESDMCLTKAGLMVPFCELDTRKFGNYSMRRANGIYNEPSKEPQCLRDFYVEARREHEYNLFKYCAKGYFFNGRDYDDPRRRHFRKDMLLYLAEGAVRCNVSDSVDASEHHLKKGYSVELVQRLAIKRQFLFHGLRKHKYPMRQEHFYEKRLPWNARDLNVPDKRYEGQHQSGIDLAHTFFGGFWGATGQFVASKVANPSTNFQQAVAQTAERELQQRGAEVQSLADLVKEASAQREYWAQESFDGQVPILGDVALFLCRAVQPGSPLDPVFAHQLLQLLRLNGTQEEVANTNCEAELRTAAQSMSLFEVPYVHEQCPELQAVLSTFEDNDRTGKFFLGGVIGAAQLDGQWSEGALKGKRFWDKSAYEAHYPELEDRHRACYLYYHAMQRFNEWDATPLYYNLVKRWGRYDLQLRVHHHCTPRGLRETLHFDVPVGPDQAPEIHEENDLEIVLDSGVLKRNTGDTVVAQERRTVQEVGSS